MIPETERTFFKDPKSDPETDDVRNPDAVSIRVGVGIISVKREENLESIMCEDAHVPVSKRKYIDLAEEFFCATEERANKKRTTATFAEA